jgi:hypothetical protein
MEMEPLKELEETLQSWKKKKKHKEKKTKKKRNTT